MGEELQELYKEIELAKQSKQAFINFITYLEIPQVMPRVNDWLERFWIDGMSKVFFDKYWNGSFDITTLYTESGEELSGLLDDIQECMEIEGNT